MELGAELARTAMFVGGAALVAHGLGWPVQAIIGAVLMAFAMTKALNRHDAFGPPA